METPPESNRTFTVRLRALPDVDGIKALRRMLKFALRHCGLRAVSVCEDMSASFNEAAK